MLVSLRVGITKYPSLMLPAAQLIWAADITSYDFEIEAYGLERKLGDWLDKKIMYSVIAYHQLDMCIGYWFFPH
ncbi:hypothetical protein D791_01268 [Nitrincola nitratireducens]|uniref:Uncharacterized protein n=1 Tax=Nitrincola nitratireducens TaxID=1229521 RepID=W9VN23_9GAMM|nr:hypothetical protein D791_01268 [Nitrincola nitratireducens]